MFAYIILSANSQYRFLLLKTVIIFYFIFLQSIMLLLKTISKFDVIHSKRKKKIARIPRGEIHSLTASQLIIFLLKIIQLMKQNKLPRFYD